MLSNRLAKAVLLAGVLQSGLVHALGVGEISLKSSLNQPLEASIPLRDVGELSEAEILVKLADRQTYQESGIDRTQFLSKLKFSVEVNEAGLSQIRVTTQDPVVEPYLDFIVELRWPNGRMLREYTLLLDLPQYGGDSAPVQAAQRSALTSPTDTTSNASDAADNTVKKSEVVEPGGARGPAAPVAPEARPEAQQTVLPPAEDPDEYRIQHKDTMWRLAERFRPSALVTTQQTMIAIYNKNPDAFIGNNINQIKSGYVLRLPSESEVQAVDPYQAITDIRDQNRRWRGEPAASSASAAAEPATTAPQVDATKSAEPTGPAPASSDGGRFSLSAGSEGEAGSGDVADLERQLQEEKEALERAQLENENMQSRVTEMETQIETLQKLIALKNRQLAALQSGVSESDLAETDQQNLQDSSAEATEESAAEGQADAVVADSNAADEAAAQSDGAAKQEDATPKQASESEPTPAAQSTQSSSEPWYSNRMVQMVLGALVIIVLLILALRQRAKDRDEGEPKYEPVIEGDDNTGFVDGAGAAETALDFDQLNEEPGAEGGEEGSGEDTAFAAASSLDLDDLDDLDLDKPASDSDLSEGSADWEQSAAWETATEGGAESVQPQTDDVMSEAEIYVAYGRYDQASSLLKNAIARDPENSALRVKLIDLYLDTRDRDNFQQAFAELREMGDEDAVARVKESMSAIEGVSDWLDEPSAAASGDMASDSASLDALDDELAFLDSDSELEAPADDVTQAELEESPSVSDNSETEVAGNSDFELDFEEAQRDADEGDLDFDTDFDLGDLDAAIGETEEQGSEFSAAGEEASFSEPAQEDDPELDMDLSEFELDTLDPEPVAPEAGLGGAETLDIDTAEEPLALETPAEETPAEEPLAEEPLAEEPGESDLSELDMDLSDFNFDADDATSEAGEEASANEPESSDAEDDFSVDLESDLSSDLGADFGDSLDSPDADIEDDRQVESQPATTFDSDDLSIESSEPASEEAESSAADSLAGAGDTSSEFDFEDDGSEETLNALMEAADAEADGELSADYADELMQTQDDTVAAPEATTPAPTDSGDLDVEELVFDEFDADPEEGGEFSLGSDADEVATKLDLARAYVDMGDKDGAREILDEVLEEGDDAQRSEAQGLIDQL